MQTTLSYLGLHGERGLSLPEIVIVIAVLGVLAAIIVPNISGIFSGSQDATATSNLAVLNQAVLKFNQANWDLVLAADDGSSDDEVAVFRSLQYRATNYFGSPYLSPNITMMTNNSPTSYRAIWNGRMFQATNAGTTIGIDLLKMNDGGTPAEFDANYKPVGAP